MGVATHPAEISPSILKLMFLTPLYNPIPITQPIITCEEDTGTIGIGGRPILTNTEESHEDENIKSTSAWARTVTRAASEESSTILFPIRLHYFF